MKSPMRSLAAILPRMAMGDTDAEAARWSRGDRVAPSGQEAVEAGFDTLPL